MLLFLMLPSPPQKKKMLIEQTLTQGIAYCFFLNLSIESQLQLHHQTYPEKLQACQKMQTKINKSKRERTVEQTS